jgi:hypothetical protein
MLLPYPAGRQQVVEAFMSKRRKSPHYVAEIATLIRAAQPTYAEIEGEPDLDKRQKRQRECDRATDELIGISRNRRLFGQLSRADQLQIQWFINGLKRSRREFPTRKGGRPPDQHRRLLIAVKMAELIKRGATVADASKLVCGWHNAYFNGSLEPKSVEAIYYDKDSEWQRLLHVELSRRAQEKQADEALAGQGSARGDGLHRSTRSQSEKPL